jgi:hypothetical protein
LARTLGTTSRREMPMKTIVLRCLLVLGVLGWAAACSLAAESPPAPAGAAESAAAEQPDQPADDKGMFQPVTEKQAVRDPLAGAVESAFELPKKTVSTPDQKQKLAALRQQYEPDLREALEKVPQAADSTERLAAIKKVRAVRAEIRAAIEEILGVNKNKKRQVDSPPATPYQGGTDTSPPQDSYDRWKEKWREDQRRWEERNWRDRETRYRQDESRRLEDERKRYEDARKRLEDQRKHDDQDSKRKEAEARKQKEMQDKKQKEADARRQKEAQDKKQKDAEAKKQREEQAKKQKEAEAKRQKEAQDKKRSKQKPDSKK